MNKCLITVIAAILIAITVTDIKTMTIPNRYIATLFVAAVASFWIMPATEIGSRILGFFIVSVPMFCLTLVIEDCFGGGDIKLIAVSGLLLGWERTILATFLAIILGGLFSIILLMSKRIKKENHIAFGPFLAVGIWISLCYGSTLLSWYFGFFIY